MTIIALGGTDPGLIHTGVVLMEFDSERKEIRRESVVVEGVYDSNMEFDSRKTAIQITAAMVAKTRRKETMWTVEKYRDRGTVFSTHAGMRELEKDIRGLAPSGTQFLENMGAKKIITPKIAAVFGVLTFPTTHHQDLQAAARIALLAGLKEPEINRFLYHVVADFLKGESWQLV